MERQFEQFGMFGTRQERNLVFFFVCVGVTALTFGFFYLIDFLPEKPTDSDYTNRDTEILSSSQDVENTGENILGTDTVTVLPGEPIVTGANDVPNEPARTGEDPYPSRIIFDTLDKTIAVQNPSSASISVLDDALLRGAVRHPASADFANEGTIFLFGHSSYLPNVINKNFQAFNGVQNLSWGDRVRLQSSDTEYVYRVDRVYEVKASEAEVAVERSEAKLVLSTCNTFGSKDDRYIVEATLVDSYAI